MDSSDASETSNSCSDESTSLFRKPQPKQRPITEKQPQPLSLQGSKQLRGKSTTEQVRNQGKDHVSTDMDLPHSIQRLQAGLQSSPSSSSASTSNVAVKKRKVAFDDGVETSQKSRLEDEGKTKAIVGKGIFAKTTRKPPKPSAFANMKTNETQPSAKKAEGGKPTDPASSRAAKRSKSKKDNPHNSDQLSKPADPASRSEQDAQMLAKFETFVSNKERSEAQIAGGRRSALEADAKIKSLEAEVEEMKTAVKDVLKYGDMLTPAEHGKLGGALQVLKAKLQFVWGE